MYVCIAVVVNIQHTSLLRFLLAVVFFSPFFCFLFWFNKHFISVLNLFCMYVNIYVCLRVYVCVLHTFTHAFIYSFIYAVLCEFTLIYIYTLPYIHSLNLLTPPFNTLLFNFIFFSLVHQRFHFYFFLRFFYKIFILYFILFLLFVIIVLVCIVPVYVCIGTLVF